MISGGILVLHQAFEPMREPSPQRLAAKERPVLELGTIVQREAGEEVAFVAEAGLLEIAAVAGPLEQMRG